MTAWLTRRQFAINIPTIKAVCMLIYSVCLFSRANLKLTHCPYREHLHFAPKGGFINTLEGWCPFFNRRDSLARIELATR